MKSRKSLINDQRYSILIENDESETFIKFTVVPNSYKLKSTLNFLLLIVLNSIATKTLLEKFELSIYKGITLRLLVCLITCMTFRKPTIETITVIRNYGVQVTKTNGIAILPNSWITPWIERSKFLARDTIVDIIINEGFVKNQQVIFYLAILVKEAERLTLLFSSTRLRLKDQRIIYNLARNCLFDKKKPFHTNL